MKKKCEQLEIEGKDRSVIVHQIMSRNCVVDNLVKFRLPQTWNSAKEQPVERVLSFLCSIVNTHISIFTLQVFRKQISAEVKLHELLEAI